jgi:hypothetical protein
MVAMVMATVTVVAATVVAATVVNDGGHPRRRRHPRGYREGRYDEDLFAAEEGVVTDPRVDHVDADRHPAGLRSREAEVEALTSEAEARTAGEPQGRPLGSRTAGFAPDVGGDRQGRRSFGV